jgi:hypothetical protein
MGSKRAQAEICGLDGIRFLGGNAAMAQFPQTPINITWRITTLAP